MAGDVVTEETKKQFTLEEVAKHTTHDDCWLIIGNQSNGTETRCILLFGSVESSLHHSYD
jgi:hypothetical protein